MLKKKIRTQIKLKNHNKVFLTRITNKKIEYIVNNLKEDKRIKIESLNKEEVYLFKLNEIEKLEFNIDEKLNSGPELRIEFIFRDGEKIKTTTKNLSSLLEEVKNTKEEDFIVIESKKKRFYRLKKELKDIKYDVGELDLINRLEDKKRLKEKIETDIKEIEEKLNLFSVRYK